MKNCAFEHVAGGWLCPGCGFRWDGAEPPLKECWDASAAPHDDIVPSPPAVRAASKGPGDHLRDAILHWVGQSPSRECDCTDRINQMNAWGPAGCREHLDEIVDWLVGEATNRGWWKRAVAVPGSRHFIKRMVLRAIKRADY